ncbi:MAG TPA: YbhB/YbcL family Raf kinase inhibitor-like protein [Candidatus Paceibacterota bacterium]
MKIESVAIREGEMVPVRYTCDGEEISPAVSWSDTPAGTKSFALIFDDPDIPPAVRERLGTDAFDHWILYNIPPETRSIPEGESAGVLGRSSAGEAKYIGPCPPDREHRYFLKLYALDTLLDLPPSAAKKQVEQSMQGHVLAETTVVARYDRTR